jgi:uroporphyrinogen decarboxylase
MTPRERWVTVFNGETPDRIPMDYWATAETTAILMKHLRCESERKLQEHLHIDKPITVQPVYRGPILGTDFQGTSIDPVTGLAVENTARIDLFGNRYREADYGAGKYLECVDHALSSYDCIEDIEENFTWPSADWWDYSVIASQVEGHDDVPVRGGGSEPLLVYKYLRGDERAAVDLIENPELVHYCLDKLFEYSYQNSLRIFEQIPGRVTITYVAEDLGTQEGLLYSPEMIRQFLLPRMERMIKLAHQAGVFVVHHDDGAIRKIIPDMIEIGIDALNPIQWRCSGMDREGLKRDFGHALVFHGGVDNQYTLPFGSIDEVRNEVIDNLRIFGKGGGYILSPCHNLQSITPVDNIVALYETGYEYGSSFL